MNTPCIHLQHHEARPLFLRSKQGRLGLALAWVMLLVSAEALRAQEWSWNVNAAGNWNLGTNWNPNVTGGPSGMDAIVNFTNDISASRTITLNVNATVGTLTFGDFSGGSVFTLAASGGSKLTFEVSDGFAVLNKTNDGGSDVISAGIVLNSGLSVNLNDPTNSQAMVLNGLIESGTGDNAPQPGDVAIMLDIYNSFISDNHQILQIGNAQNNTFTGQIVINSGTLRSEGDGKATLFGAMGAGNETVIKNGGRLDLRNHDFNLDNALGLTEIIMLEGSGWRGLGALLNSSTTGTVSHVGLTGDATIGGISTIEFRGYTNTSDSSFIRAILDADGNALTKLGINTIVLYDTDILGLDLLNIREGEFRIAGSTSFEAGTVINLGYNPGVLDYATFDPADFSHGSRSQNDVNSLVAGTASLSEARLEFNNTPNLTHDLIINLSRGSIETGSVSATAGAGNTFYTTLAGEINLVGGGIRENFFNIGGGADGAFGSGAATVYDDPGRFTLEAELDNTSEGNGGTGITKKGNRELRIVTDQQAFEGEFLVNQQNVRFLNRGYSTASGAAETQYFNVALAESGTLRKASSIILERGASLTLLNTGTNLDDRINDDGLFTLRNGYMHLITHATDPSRENWGHVVADEGTNWFMMDGRAGGLVDNSFASLTLSEGAVLKIMSLNGGRSFGTGVADDRIAIADTSSIQLSGNEDNEATVDRAVVHGVFGGVIPATPAAIVGSIFRPEEQLENALAWSGSGVDFMTLETVDGVTYLRPLKDSEYSTTLAAGVNWNVTAPLGAANAIGNTPNVISDITINSLRIGETTVRAAAQDVVYIGPGATLTIESGMISFSSFVEDIGGNMEAVIRGGSGFLDMNGKVAVINSAITKHDTDTNSGTWSTYVNTNNAFLRTHMTHATGFIKTGRSNLYVETWNNYIGKTFISEGLVVLRHSGAFGSSDEVLISGEGSLYLQDGVNISGPDIRVAGSTTSSRTALRSEADHNTWTGDLILDGVDSSGGFTYSHVITARNDAVLSLYGDIYGAGNPITDSDLWTDPRLLTTSLAESGTINLHGSFRDRASGALDLPVRSTGNIDGVQYDRNNVMRFQVTGHNEMNVNVFQQWDSAGQIDVSRGYFRIMYDPSSGNGFYTDAAVNAWYANSTHTIANLIYDTFTKTHLSGTTSGTGTHNAAIFMTQEGQIFNHPSLAVYNANRDGALTLGSEHTSGEVYFGSADPAHQARILYESTGGDRDLRLYQREGGASVYNLRLMDNGTSVNSSATKIGQGTARLVDNAYGASTVERWNIMGGVMEWQQGTTGSNRFAVATAPLTMGGGTLHLIGDPANTTARSQTLGGQFRVLAGGSEIRVTSQANTTTNLIIGASSLSVIREAGGTVLFSPLANGGTVNLQLFVGAGQGQVVLPWAVFSSQAGVVNDFAVVDTGGTTAGNVRSADAMLLYNVVTEDTNVDSWSGQSPFTTGWVTESELTSFAGTVTADGAIQGARFFSQENAAISIADGTTLALERGAVLVATNVGAFEKGIHGGFLTSNEYTGVIADARSELIVHNYNPAAKFTISSVITDNSYGDHVSVTHTGTGTTVLTGQNTYTGNNYLTGGVLEISEDANLGDINAGHQLDSIIILGRGADYTQATTTIAITGGGGSGATASVLTNSTLRRVDVTNYGGGYTSNPLVTATDSDSAAESVAAVLYGVINQLYLNGGVLRTTSTFELDERRTIILGGDGGGIETVAGTTLTYSGLIASEENVVATENGYTATIMENPTFGDFSKLGEGTLVLDGAINNSAFTGLMLIKEGTLKIAVPTNLAGVLGTNESAMDGTIIYNGATLELATGDSWTTTEWITFNGSGYQGGGALRMTGTNRTYRFNGQLNIESDTIFNLANGSTLHLNESGGNLFGSGDIIRIGAGGEFRIFGNSPEWKGNLILGAGLNRLYNETGKITGVQSITLTRDAFLGLINSGVGGDPYGDRVNDAAPIFMSGFSRLRMDGTTAAFSGYETYGDLTTLSGVGRIQIDTARVTGAAGGTAAPTFAGMIFNSINREQGSIIQLHHLDNGGQFADASFGATVFNDVAVFAVKEMPVDLLHGGDGSRGTNRQILQGVFGGSYLPLLSNTFANRDTEAYSARRLMTMDMAKDPFTGADLNVMRPLREDEYVNVSNTNEAQITRARLEQQGIQADDNVALVGRESSLDSPLTTNLKSDYVTLEGDLTVNSLSVHVNSVSSYTGTSNGGIGERLQLYLGDGSTLTIASGVINVANLGVVARDGAAATSNVVNQQVYVLGGALDFNGQEAVINVGSSWLHYDYVGMEDAYGGLQSSNSDLYINSSITNANGLTKAGERSLILGGVNSYTGPTNVTQGLLYVRNEKALGQSDVVNVTGTGGFVLQEGIRVDGVTVRSGITSIGSRSLLILESGSSWGGDVVLDNVDVTGQAGSAGNSLIRNIVRSTSSIGTIYGNIYGDATNTILGALGTTAQTVSTLGQSDGVLWLRGHFRDTKDGALASPITAENQNYALRFEIAGANSALQSTSTFRGNNEFAVWVDNQWDSVGRINHEQGYLYYFGEGNFWTDAAAANMDPNNLMSGYHMGGDVSTATVNNQNLALFLTREGQVFNISSFGVGLESDLGNRTGNSMLGGVQSSGEVVFGLGNGTITFEGSAADSYHRDLRLFQRAGGETTMRFNFADGGSGVNSSITKVGGGQVNLEGSSAGGSTVEAVYVLDGRLVLRNYDVHANRRVGLNAALHLGGGTLVMQAAASFTESFGDLTVAAGGSALMASGDASIVLEGALSRAQGTGGTLHFQEVDGGAIIANGVADQRIGSWATFGVSSSDTVVTATSWAAVDGTGNLIAFSDYDENFGAGLHTDVLTEDLVAGVTSSVRFDVTGGSITSGTLQLEDGGILFSSNYGGGAAIGADVSISSAVDLILHNYFYIVIKNSCQSWVAGNNCQPHSNPQLQAAAVKAAPPNKK